MRVLSSLMALVALLVVSVDPSRAGDVEDAAARAVIAAAGAPGRALGFEFEGYVLRDRAPYGRVTLSARPDDGTWQVRDRIRPVRADADRILATAVLDARLHTRSGTYVRRNAKGFLRATIGRPDPAGGYRIEHETNDYENRLDVGGAGALSTLSAVVLFLRMAPAAPAVYELPDLDPNPGPGDPYVAPARIEVHRTAPWRVFGKTRTALVASYTRGTQTLRLALGTKDRKLLGVEFVGLPFQFVPRGSGPVGLVERAADILSPVERAVERTRALRATLPMPRTPIDFRGQVRLGENRIGTVWLRAKPSSLAGRPVWSVLESQVLRTGAAQIEGETSGMLAPDLTLLRGERIDKRPAGTSHLSYTRTAGGMRTVATSGGKAGAPAVLAAAEDATTGLMPVLLFLRHVPSTKTHYVLAGWDARFAGKPKAGSGSFAFSAADVHIEVAGEGVLALDGAERTTLQARCSMRNGRRYDVHLDPKTRALVAVVGRVPKTLLVSAQAPGTRVDWYDAVEGPPQTARQAFVKFGRGYHRPRPELLEDAFHWPSMVGHALEQKRYATGTPAARIRQDWIDVFVKMSKHRTQGDCDDLLFQILMTSRETVHPDGSVSLHTLPVYGGHIYKMAKLDGRWWIVQID